MMHACIAGIVCLAFLCGGFRVLEYGTRRRRLKVLPVVTHHKHVIDVDTVVEGREDRISRLPDDVISLIVSRLYTRDAVRTSVLSRRWKHVYTFVSEVRFYCFMTRHSHLKGKKLREFLKKFVQAVDTFLQHHSGSRIKSFDLVCCFRGCNLDSLRILTNYVGRLGVERLTIRYCCTDHGQKSIPPVFLSKILN
ncbi:putative F-box/LRR-repeat protein At5g38386 [Primulina huaijiensis]|uniref:putative F-box/LRR-repeat protein At5g38386 n=1 Tax=Primulina huaijiensis TaxID=1492673 RepID=UPI003CC76A99